MVKYAIRAYEDSSQQGVIYRTIESGLTREQALKLQKEYNEARTYDRGVNIVEYENEAPGITVLKLKEDRAIESKIRARQQKEIIAERALNKYQQNQPLSKTERSALNRSYVEYEDEQGNIQRIQGNKLIINKTTSINQKPIQTRQQQPRQPQQQQPITQLSTGGKTLIELGTIKKQPQTTTNTKTPETPTINPFITTPTYTRLNDPIKKGSIPTQTPIPIPTDTNIPTNIITNTITTTPETPTNTNIPTDIITNTNIFTTSTNIPIITPQLRIPPMLPFGFGAASGNTNTQKGKRLKYIDELNLSKNIAEELLGGFSINPKSFNTPKRNKKKSRKDRPIDPLKFIFG
jgi:hypothetical protein